MKKYFLVSMFSMISVSAVAKAKDSAQIKMCDSIQGQYEVVSVQCLDKDQQEVGNSSQPDAGQITFDGDTLNVKLTKQDKRFGGGSVRVSTISNRTSCVIEDVGARDVIDSLNGVQPQVLGAFTHDASQVAKLELRASAMNLCPSNQRSVVSQIIELKRTEPARPELTGPTQSCSVYGPQAVGEDKALLESQLDGENVIVGTDQCLRSEKSCRPASLRLRVIQPSQLLQNAGRTYSGWFYYRQIYMSGQPYTIEAGRISADGRFVPKQNGYPSFLAGYPGKILAASEFQIKCRQAQ